MKLYNDPSRGIVYNPNWPVEPDYPNAYYEQFAHPDIERKVVQSQYNSALQTAIGEAKEMEDQRLASAIISNAFPLGVVLRPSTFYEVPDMKLELQYQYWAYTNHWHDCDKHSYDCMIKLSGKPEKARIVYRIVSEPKQEPKVETQEELWLDAANLMLRRETFEFNELDDSDALRNLLNEFTITRKKLNP